MYTRRIKTEQPLDRIDIINSDRPLTIVFSEEEKIFHITFKYTTTRISFDDMWALFSGTQTREEKLQEENTRLTRKLEDIQNQLAKLSQQ